MKNNDACLKCGSAGMIGSARIQTRNEHDSIRIAVDTDPHALLLKGTAYSNLLARVCPRCGFIELYAEDVEPLAAAYEKAQSKS